VAALIEWFGKLNERERRLVLAAAAVALVTLCVGLFTLDRSVAHAHVRIAHKQSDLAWMRGVAPLLAQSGPPRSVPSSQRSLIVVVDASAREAGLGSSLASSEPSGQGGLRVRLDKAPFDTLIGWLARLSGEHGVRVESATIDNAGAPGLVNAGIVLSAAR